MAENVTFKGQPFQLTGQLPKEGGLAPDSELVDSELKAVKLSNFKGKPFLLLSFPSLDTPVCSKEAERFNRDLSKHSSWLKIVGISMDLPFAQSRWCGVEGVTNIQFLSDYRTHEFGEKYGIYIKELGLLARAVFLIDSEMKISYIELVKEIASEPNYNEIREKIEHLKEQF